MKLIWNVSIQYISWNHRRFASATIIIFDEKHRYDGIRAHFHHPAFKFRDISSNDSIHRMCFGGSVRARDVCLLNAKVNACQTPTKIPIEFDGTCSSCIFQLFIYAEGMSTTNEMFISDWLPRRMLQIEAICWNWKLNFHCNLLQPVLRFVLSFFLISSFPLLT